MKKGDNYRNRYIHKKNIFIRLVILLFICIFLIADFSGLVDSAQVNVNFSNEVGRVRDDFYGVNTHFFGSNWSFVDKENDGAITYGDISDISDYAWHRQELLNAGIKEMRTDMDLEYNSPAEGVFNTTALSSYYNINTHISLVKWAYENNVKILYIAQHMPLWLANQTSTWCTSSDRYSHCPATNYTKFGDTVVNFISNVTNNGLYSSAIEVEVWNEPNLAGEWLNNIGDRTNANISLEYNKLYNATRIAIKAKYPNIAVGGPSVTMNGVTGNIIAGFLSNFSQQIDFVSFHHYRMTYSFPTDIQTLISTCAKYNSNCSNIKVSEWGLEANDVGNLMMNATDKTNFTRYLTQSYIDLLNNYPANVSSSIYQWSERYKYDSTNYPQHILWSFVSEAGLDNPTPTFYPPYNVTKNFATYHSAGSMVVKSNSSLSNIKVVASKKGSSQYITVINTGTNTSVSLGIFGNISSAIRDLETNQNFTIIKGMVNISSIKQYQIRYFVNTIVATETSPETPAPIENSGSSGGGGGGGGGSINYNNPIIISNTSNNQLNKTVEIPSSIDTEEQNREKNETKIGKVIGTGKAIFEDNSVFGFKTLLILIILSGIAFLICFLIIKIRARKRAEELRKICQGLYNPQIAS